MVLLAATMSAAFMVHAAAPVSGQAALKPGVPMASLASSKAHKALLTDVARAGARLIAVGERGHIVVSDDEGVTWQQIVSPVRSLLTAVYFVDATHGWAVGHDAAVLATVDGGNSWQLQHYREFVPEVYSAGEVTTDDESFDEAGVDDYIEEDMDGADEAAAGGREGVPLLDVWFADAQRGIAVGAYGLMLRTSDGGKNWIDSSSELNNLDGWHLNAIDGITGKAGVVMIAGEKGMLFRSINAGASFVAVPSPYDGSFFGVTGSRDGTIYVYGLQGRLYRSSDQGQNWVALATGVTSGLNNGCRSAGDAVLLTGNAGVALSLSAAGIQVERRLDRRSILACAVAAEGVVLVGEAGAQLADAHGKRP